MSRFRQLRIDLPMCQNSIVVPNEANEENTQVNKEEDEEDFEEWMCKYCAKMIKKCHHCWDPRSYHVVWHQIEPFLKRYLPPIGEGAEAIVKQVKFVVAKVAYFKHLPNKILFAFFLHKLLSTRECHHLRKIYYMEIMKRFKQEDTITSIQETYGVFNELKD